MSTNKVKYKHIYYISQYNRITDDFLKNKLNQDQNVEITDIRWSTHNEMIKDIRDYSIEKINILNTIFFTIKNLILDTKRKLEEIL